MYTNKYGNVEILLIFRWHFRFVMFDLISNDHVNLNLFVVA